LSEVPLPKPILIQIIILNLNEKNMSNVFVNTMATYVPFALVELANLGNLGKRGPTQPDTRTVLNIDHHSPNTYRYHVKFLDPITNMEALSWDSCLQVRLRMASRGTVYFCCVRHIWAIQFEVFTCLEARGIITDKYHTLLRDNDNSLSP
jgi:hypothetical protein